MKSVVASILFATVLAGCLQSPASEPGATVPPVATKAVDCLLGAASALVHADWKQTCEARASSTAGSKTEMWIAINPKDTDNVVVGVKDLNPASSPGCVWNGVFVTHDAGRTWKDVVIGGKYADRKPGDPWYGYRCNTDPDFRFDAKGDLHYGIELYDVGATGVGPANDVSKTVDSGYKVLLATSHDGGDTWPDVITYQPDLLYVTDYSRMTINPKTQSILESIGSEGGRACNVMISRDGGKSATFVPVATKDGIPCNSGGQGAIGGSPSGTVVIVGNGIAARSTDDGATWTDSNRIFTFKRIPGTFAESKYRITNNYEVDYDLTDGPNKGTLYVAYAAADRTGDEADVYIRSSKDDGKTWSDASIVNDDAPGAHQWMPNVAVAGDGSVHVFYMDKRYDSAHKLIDITHAWSLDGGKTWTNERVSDVSYDGDLGVHQDGFPFIGDYLGVDAVGKDVWAAFPDASGGGVPVAAAAHVRLP